MNEVEMSQTETSHVLGGLVVVVTGTRAAEDTPQLRERWARVIEARLRELAPTVVIHGDCRGIDRIADWVAIKLDVPDIRSMPARWTDGRKAGPIRNRTMIEAALRMRDYWGMTVQVEAFHTGLYDGSGTTDCVRQGRSRGLPAFLTQLSGYTVPVDTVTVLPRSSRTLR